MRRELFLLAVCTLAVVLPRNNRSVESETEESELQELVITTTTVKPESKVINIVSSGDFETKLSEAGEKLVVIFAMTSWCPQSLKAEPNVEHIAANTMDLVILKINVDNVKNTPGIGWKYGVTGIGSVPTFFFVKNRVLLEYYAGSSPKKLRSALTKYLAGFRNDSNEED